MLELIPRNPEFVEGYKAYCQESYENNVVYFCPTNPKSIDEDWYQRTKDWYDKKELGLIPEQPVSFHYWAVDEERFIGEFQLRTEFTEELASTIGNIGYSVRVSEQGKGYGKEILKQGLGIARRFNLEKVLLTINADNIISIHICEKLGGILMDKINAYNQAEGNHILCRYWIYL